jgi:DNA-directed RNA polymerase subunit RPC12/RpoP
MKKYKCSTCKKEYDSLSDKIFCCDNEVLCDHCGESAEFPEVGICNSCIEQGLI